MSLSPGSEPEDGENPFVDLTESPETPDGPDPWFGLRNTEPHVLPEEIGSQLSVEAEWWHHFLTGFAKQSGGGGAEAWMHYVMAIALLFLSLTDDSDGDGEASSSGDGYMPQGPQEEGQQGPDPV